MIMLDKDFEILKDAHIGNEYIRRIKMCTDGQDVRQKAQNCRIGRSYKKQG